MWVPGNTHSRCGRTTTRKGLCGILEGWDSENMGNKPAYLHSSGDILWNLVSILSFPLSSLSWKVWPPQCTHPRCWDTVPSISSSSPGRLVSGQRCRQWQPAGWALGLPVTSGAVLLGHKHHVDTVSCGQMCFFSPCSGAYFCLFSAFLCTCVSSSLPPLLPALSLLVTHAGRFSVYKINVAAHLLLLGNSQTIKKMHFSMMKCHEQWMYSK